MQAPLRPAVKTSGRLLAATIVAGQQPQGRLFYVRDRSSSLRFLVDTGAQVSIVPPTSSDRAAKQRDSPLQAINGTLLDATTQIRVQGIVCRGQRDNWHCTSSGG